MESDNIRKLIKNGSSHAVTLLPIEMIRELSWQEKQKVIINKRGSTITIKDWK